MNDTDSLHADARDSITTAQEEGMADVFSANEVRLSVRQWCFVGTVLFAVALGLPHVWNRSIPFTPGDDYRIPYGLSQDYWTYERWITHATSRGDQIVLLGDSVIWGEYVTPQESLAQYLSRDSTSARFVNGGFNGAHPLALEGLVAILRPPSGRAAGSSALQPVVDEFCGAGPAD